MKIHVAADPAPGQPIRLQGEVCTVIVTYNASPWIERCLGSLLASSLTHTVIVVDNNSGDATCQIIADRFPGVHLRRLASNVGFGAGNNLGIKLALGAGASFVFLLNQDAYVFYGSVLAMKSFMQRHPDVGVLSPLHCSPQPGRLDTKTAQGYLHVNFARYISDACCADSVDESYVGRGVNAAAWFVRADVFSRYGGFDPLFFMYGEDDDLLTRWQHHAVAFHLVPAIRIVHLRQSAARQDPSWLTDLRWRSMRRRSHLICRLKRPGFSVQHSLSLLLAEGFLEPLALFPLRRNPRDLAAGIWAALSVLGEFAAIRRHQAQTERVGAHFI